MLDSIKQLREETQASFGDCRRALIESNGDIEKARKILSSYSKNIAAKKSSRTIKAGVIESYIHPDKKIGVLLELGCETDFVALNKDFQDLAHNLALHIAAMNPQYISKEQIPESIIEAQKAIFREEFKDASKPVDIVEKIIDGKLNKYYADICLMDQPYVKNPDIIIRDLINEVIAKIGENIVVGRFVRYQI